MELGEFEAIQEFRRHELEGARSTFICECCLFEGSDPTRFVWLHAAWLHISAILLCKGCAAATPEQRATIHAVALDAQQLVMCRYCGKHEEVLALGMCSECNTIEERQAFELREWLPREMWDEAWGGAPS